MGPKFLYFLHFSSCLGMTGVIWLVQLVHYPSFHFIDKERFKSFENFHARSITFIVFPLMLTELITCFVLDLPHPWKLLNICGVLLLWLSTMLLSMPRHQRLSRYGYNHKITRELILTNWPRTIIWTLRSLILIYFSMSQI